MDFGGEEWMWRMEAGVRCISYGKILMWLFLACLCALMIAAVTLLFYYAFQLQPNKAPTERRSCCGKGCKRRVAAGEEARRGLVGAPLTTLALSCPQTIYFHDHAQKKTPKHICVLLTRSHHAEQEAISMRGDVDSLWCKAHTFGLADTV
eukprot:1161887-Pelagomonas_calceolata.AAC.3